MLAGIRVLDLTDERGHLAGRILADLGAEVILIEPPGGDPLRRRGPFLSTTADPNAGVPFISANPGKRSLVLDLDGCEADRETLLALVDTADVVIESSAPGVMAARGIDLLGRKPDLVHCAITAFGRRGPYASFAGHDLVCVAMGGNAVMTGAPERPPLRCSLPTAYMHAGPEAVIGILMALHGRDAGLGGQFVDVSLQECQLATLISGPGQVPLGGPPRGRTGDRTGRTREIWRCKDGFVSYGLRGGPARAGSLAATVAWMAETGMAPDWLQAMDWTRFSPLALDDAEIERLEAAFGAFFATQTMRVLFERALKERILLAPCNDAREILEQPQLLERGLFETVAYPEYGAQIKAPMHFARSSCCEIGAPRRAPMLDADGEALRAEVAAQANVKPAAPAPVETASGGGLFEGLKILELGAGAAGPVATRYFAEQGARVVRIESEKRPDFLRILHLTAENRNDPGILERAPMYVLLNPNKESVAVNMKTERGLELVSALVQWADVVAENFAPGVMAKFGLDPASLLERRPELVVVSGCLFGQTGPQRGYPGFGGQGAAIAGFNHMTGWPDTEAIGPYATITDSLSPRFVATALLAALRHRRITGEGQCLDVSQIETGVYGLSEMIVRYSGCGESMSRMGNRSEYAAPHGMYPCLPDAGVERFIAIAVFDDRAWHKLIEVMGAPAWAREAKYATTAGRLEEVDALEADLAAWTRTQEAEALMHRLQAAGVEAGVARDFEQLVADPQLAARGHFVELPHEPLGPLYFERAGFRISGSPGGFDRPGPHLGEHTRAVLGADLGLSDSEIDALIADEVLA